MKKAAAIELANALHELPDNAELSFDIVKGNSLEFKLVLSVSLKPFKLTPKAKANSQQRLKKYYPKLNKGDFKYTYRISFFGLTKCRQFMYCKLVDKELYVQLPIDVALSIDNAIHVINGNYK